MPDYTIEEVKISDRFTITVYQYPEGIGYVAESVTAVVNQPLSSLIDFFDEYYRGQVAIPDIQPTDMILPPIAQYYWLQQWNQGNKIARDLLSDLSKSNH